jgi:hypothetical protein
MNVLLSVEFCDLCSLLNIVSLPVKEVKMGWICSLDEFGVGNKKCVQYSVGS